MKTDMEERFAQSSHYNEYEGRLIALHMAMAQGDEEEADRLRDEMDRPAALLSPSEIERLNGLSADLYMLADEEIYEPNNMAPLDLIHYLGSVWANGDRELTLQLLRRGPEGLSPDRVAFLRARCYDALGHTNPALQFYRHAVNLAPGSDDYKLALLFALFRHGTIEEAIREAQSYCQQTNTSADLLIQSAAVLFRAAKDMPSEDALLLREQARAVLESVLPGRQSELAANEISFGWVVLGAYYEAASNHEAAINAYSAAIEADSTDDMLFVLRGKLRERASPGSGDEDFEKAIRLNTRQLFPYLVLATRYLIAQDFDRCLLLCQQILTLAQGAKARALAYEYCAIVWAGRREFSQAEVFFQRAMDLDPLNERLRNNYQWFRSMSNVEAAPLAVPDWQMDYGPYLTDAMDPSVFAGRLQEAMLVG